DLPVRKLLELAQDDHLAVRQGQCGDRLLECKRLAAALGALGRLALGVGGELDRPVHAGVAAIAPEPVVAGMADDGQEPGWRLARFARFLALGTAALAFAAGAAGPKAYVGNFKDSTLSVIDTASGAVVATIPVAAGPHGMAVSGDGRVVWVTGDGSSSMSVID